MSNTKHLADLLKVCSILPALAIMPAMAETITVGTGETKTLTGAHTDVIVNDGSVYFLVSDDKSQLAVMNIEDATISNVTTNYANGQSGFVKGYENSKVVVKNSEFSDNKSDYYSAIWAVSPEGNVDGGILEISDSKFLRNEADDGAAVGAMWLTNISNTLFEGNKATYVNGDGGVLFLGAVSQSKLTDVVFKSNSSAADGGAIAMRAVEEGDNSRAKLDILDSEFKGNSAAKKGGAIYSTFYDSEQVKDSVYIEDTDFVANSAKDGGAIYNEGLPDRANNVAAMKVVDSDFVGNIATNFGGAMYNASKLVVSDSEFSENDAYVGGAMFLASGSDTAIDQTNFEANTADFGGAIYTATGIKNIDITNSTFTNNVALGAGAAGIFNKGSLTNVLFDGNKATDATEDGGGALFFGATAQAVLDKGTFVSNESAGVGGAIATRSPDKGDNSAAKLDIKNSTFRENVAATQGGAIYTAFHNSKEAIDNVYLADSVFVANKANEGGAIYNEGLADRGDNFASIYMTGVTFKDNVASVNGGAVFNGAGGTVNLAGINVFSGNVANGLANDIHNMGTLNITGGTTSFDGGVTGTGTFTLASDAILELGTATINQGKIDLYGTVVASMLNDSARGGSYGRFISSDLNVYTGASFKLNVGAAGTYNIWDGKIVDAEQVTVGDIYEIAGIDTNGVKIVTKSVADIAETVGISTQAAGAVAGLANANTGKAHQVSLALQDALDAGDVEYIERETKKLNPTDKPVAQAAASSVQNQVLSLTSGRMAGGISVGRAGGDEKSQENGFWIQGLFNKSKFADAFHGYTRGVALGADTLIDNKWTIGGGLAFNNTDVHADGGAHTDISSKTLFLYGQYKPNNWFVNATATYSMSEYTENKTVAGVGLGATYDVDAYGAQIMTGYDFTPGITTEAGLRYLHVAQDDYIDGRDAQIMATDTDFLTGIAGLKYAFAIENDWAIQLRPELRAAMTYDFISDDTATTVVMPGVEAYAVNGERLSRMGGEFGIGLTALYKGMEVSLMYDLDLHQDYTSQTGMIKFRGRF